MTAKQITQKNFQRIDVDALERLLQVDPELIPVHKRVFAYIKSFVDKFIV